MDRCPRCGADAVYVGLQSIECATADCPNYRAPSSDSPEPPRPSAVASVDTDDDELDLPYELWLEAYGFF